MHYFNKLAQACERTYRICIACGHFQHVWRQVFSNYTTKWHGKCGTKQSKVPAIWKQCYEYAQHNYIQQWQKQQLVLIMYWGCLTHPNASTQGPPSGRLTIWKNTIILFICVILVLSAHPPGGEILMFFKFFRWAVTPLSFKPPDTVCTVVRKIF